MVIQMRALLFSTALVIGATSALGAETLSLQTLHKKGTAAEANNLRAFFALDSRNSFLTLSEDQAKSGAKNKKVAQYFDGLRVVEHTAVIGTDTSGNINRLHGYIAQGIEKDITSTTAILTPAQAIEAAKAAHRGIYKIDGDWVYRDLSVEKAIFITKEDKATVVYNVSYFVDNTNALLPSRPNIMIDANTGTVVSYRDSLAFGDAQATGPGGNQKTGKYTYGTDFPALSVTSDSSNICHFSTTNVKTIDMKNEGTGNPQNDGDLNTVPHAFTCFENTDRPMNGAFSPLNDAHFFGSTVFNMYQSWFGINPLKTDLKLRVHYGKEFENAFWDGKQMTFGDGKDIFYPLVVLDVTAHEVSHGFTEFNSKLGYASQSGGINESFSDIAGEAAEFFMRGHNDFLVGAEVAKDRDALRYMDDPTRDNISIKNVNDFKEATDEMACLFCKLTGGGAACAEVCGTDVHHSSGIYNKVFYDVANSAGWTTKKTFEVFVKANQTYWTEKTNFKDGAAGLIDAATDLGYGTEEFKRAFRGVGIVL